MGSKRKLFVGPDSFGGHFGYAGGQSKAFTNAD